MLTFPNAKINLGLRITEKRTDGYHNLETIFYPVPLSDALEITLREDSSKKYSFYSHGMEVPGDPNENLVVKAYLLLDGMFNLPPLDINLIKKTPLGAGLGGGSSDASYMLKALNQLFSLNLSEKKLEEYSATLGADCAFFIKNEPTFAEGIGNVFTPISLSLKGYQIIIIKPQVAISTREAFANIQPQKPKESLKEVINRPISEWKDCLFNDFESSIFPKYPLIKDIKESLYASGAVYASMSGSGSSVFGLFSPDFNRPTIPLESDWFYFKGTL